MPMHNPPAPYLEMDQVMQPGANQTGTGHRNLISSNNTKIQAPGKVASSQDNKNEVDSILTEIQ